MKTQTKQLLNYSIHRWPHSDLSNGQDEANPGVSKDHRGKLRKSSQFVESKKKQNYKVLRHNFKMSACGSPTCNLDSKAVCATDSKFSKFLIKLLDQKIQSFTFSYYLFYNFDCHPKDQVVICHIEA